MCNDNVQSSPVSLHWILILCRVRFIDAFPAGGKWKKISDMIVNTLRLELTFFEQYTKII